ncbi:MAG: DUF3307 domain-containing protein [Chloroflexota bacterium]
MNAGVLVLSWLVLCHLLADFVLQPDHVATRKFGRGPDAWRALGIHVAIVGLVAAPIVLVYGLPGVAYVVVTVVTHLLIDRGKVEATLRMAVGAPPVAGSPPAPDAAPADPEMVPGWSPMPGVWFLLDQLAHIAVLVGAWALFLARAQPLGWWDDLVARIAASGDGETVGRVTLALVVLAALVVANTRAGSLFVGTLDRAPRPPVVQDVRTADGPSVARVGATIGVIERLLIAALVLSGGVAAVGLVIAAKTIARFRQLEDRLFAEYYLLGTLGSVALAVITSLIAQLALA